MKTLCCMHMLLIAMINLLGKHCLSKLLDENNSYKMSERPPHAAYIYIETTIEVSKERDWFSIYCSYGESSKCKKILENVMTNFIDYMSSRKMAEESYDF